MRFKNIAAIVLTYAFLANCHAQDSTTILIPSGSSVLTIVPPAKQFRFPEFKPGKVVFKDGSIAPAQLNYSFLSGEVEFIGPANDTLAISDDKTSLIKDILIDTTVFCFNKDYYEVIASNPDIGRVLKKQLFVEMTKEKIGAYDMVAPNSSIQTMGAVGSNSGNSFRTGLIANENLLIRLTTDYFIENKDNDLLPVNKKNLLKTFPSRKKQINEYLDKNTVDFRREDDLKRLFLAINN